MKRSKLTLFAATIGVASLALTACSSGGGGGDDAPGSTLQRLQDEGSITVAIADERPYSWIGEDGEPTGATIALHKEIFSRLGIDEVEVTEVDFPSLIPGLTANRFDAISASMSILPDRCEQAAFTKPELMYTTGLLVPKGNPEGLTDLDSVLAKDGSVTLAVMGGAIEQGYAEQLGISNVIQVDNVSQGIEVVQTGRADVFSHSSASLNWLTKDLDDVEATDAFVQTIDGVEQIGAGATVFNLDAPELVEAYNEEFQKILDDGDAYLKLIEPFGFTAENLPPADLTTEQLCAGDLG